MNKYEVIGLVGEGSFGRVFKANERETKETVALKVIRKCGRTQKELVSLRSECEIQRHLNHPNIIHMIDSFETETEIIVVTEFCKKDLHEILGKEGYLKEEQTLGIVSDLVSALHYLHSHRVLHRDLKPQNVLVDNNGVAKLCDFGFARSMSRGTHVLTSIKGTPLYMAPELIEELPYDHNADLWSLGCIVYEMLVGVPPFVTNSILHLVRLIRYEPIKWPLFLSDECRDFLQGLLQKDPNQRLTWPNLHQHPFLQGKVFIDDNICMPVPLTSKLTSSQTLAKESQKQDLVKKAAAQTLLKPCMLHTSNKPTLQHTRQGASSSLQMNSLAYPHQGARGYSIGAIGEPYHYNSARANGITSVRQYATDITTKTPADELKVDKLCLEEQKCRCQPFDRKADLNRKYEERTDKPKTVGVSSIAELYPNEPMLTTTPLETEEWLVFLQHSMEEIMEGDFESIRDKSFISMITAPLSNPGASSEVVKYIVTLLSLPLIPDLVAHPDPSQIQQVYLESKVVASLMLALKLLTSHLAGSSGSGESLTDVNALSDEQLLTIQAVSLVTSHLILIDTAFLSQFCDIVSMLHLQSRMRVLITLRRRQISVVTNLIAIFCKILKEMPENANIVEEVIFKNHSAGEELHAMLTNENPILRSRTCMLLQLAGRVCQQSLKSCWNKELKDDIETLAYDSCQNVRGAADNAVVELKRLPFYTNSSWEEETEYNSG